MKSKARTDIGKKKDNNEDKFFLNDTLKLYMVSDGMGGHNSGEIAAQMVIDSFKYEIIDHGNKELPDICRKTNEKIIQKGEEDPKYYKMGATLVLLWLDNQDLKLLNLGDSRIYHIFGDKETSIIQQITSDHSRVAELVRDGKMSEEEAENHPWKNILSRHFGNKKSNNTPEIIRNIYEYEHKFNKILSGDYFLLCCDGLTNMVDDETIKNTILKKGIDAVDDLIDMANNAGGEDNITAIVVEIEKGDFPIYEENPMFPTFSKILTFLHKKRSRK